MWYYQFKIYGLRFKKPLKFKSLLLYTPQHYDGYSLLETIRRFKNIDETKQKVERVLELFQIFYLTWITYFGIYRRKNSNEKWDFVEATTTSIIPSGGLHPLFDELFLDDFLKLTFNRKRYTNQILKSNILLINARISGMLIETRFLLRWLALESLMREDKSLWKSKSKKIYQQLKERASIFAKDIRSKKLKDIFLDKINRTKGDVKFREAFKKFVRRRKLPVVDEDIADCKKVRDKIVHYGSMERSKSATNYNDLSNRLESLVRNLLVYYLGLKFDPEWKKWWSRSLWHPQKR